MQWSMQKLGRERDGKPAAPGARGRPRAFDRDAALERATHLFWAKGYEATSIADLTAAMGIGGTSLYAAFGSKEALYAEALRHYAETNHHHVWAGFGAAATAREAVRLFLTDSAAALTGAVADIPRGCMVTLSSVGSEGHVELGDTVKAARAVTLERLLQRFERAVDEGELPAGTDLRALARFVQTLQNGMSILARDGAGREELQAVASIAMEGWDARTASGGAG